MKIKYRKPEHQQLPHVVKFSGGRSSAMLVFLLLEHNLLDAQRGDVIVFNNTSAEHERTYDFVIRCKQEAERISDIPFLLTEFATYEDKRRGYWSRRATWRLALPVLQPVANGMHWRGEIFEENIAHGKQIPTVFQRSCTRQLKIRVTHQFLSEWFSGNASTLHLGHQLDHPRATPEEIAKAYHAFGGRSLSPEQLEQYSSFLATRPFQRYPQRYSDYMAAPRHEVPHLKARAHKGRVPLLNDTEPSCVTLVGLRFDEDKRTKDTIARCQDDGAVSYAPMHQWHLKKTDVLSFWQKQAFDLQIDSEYSNCVLCFLKGRKALKKLAMNPKSTAEPASWQWWSELESRYARKSKDNKTFGFFGLTDRPSYASIMKSEEDFMETAELPCFCTD